MKTHYKNVRHLLLIAILLIGISGCKKDEQPVWERCTDCSLEQITGTYAGKATLYEYNTDSELINEVYSEEAYLELTGSGSSGIAISVGVINLYNTNISAGWEAGEYTISSFSDGEFNAEIYRQGDQIKIKGINKRFREIVIEEDSVVVILRSLFDFEVIKPE
ncbi:MAG: hypothetical protein KJ578_07000 [Bacteroidetes bacterium]|nr:hypothetical protein [Bacteroidota bacterium]MBU1578442.1 hypothetical protein [Bacteroidota bacterium]MBU2464904.1 hypothetical protein [Bacteroidota bacterium]MBU2557508.1 hypothetical protein [Bacteroidota bacterium]